MTLVFPTLQPEELLYSACARYRDLFDFPSDRAVALELFGTREATAILDLPVGLEHFVARLPAGQPYTVETLIRFHTTLPYHAPFLRPEQVSKITARMRLGRKGTVVPALLGTGRGSVLAPPELRFCADCASQDRKRNGEAYWRRVHQMTGVYVCPEHGVPLLRGPGRRKDLAGVFVYHSVERALQRESGLTSIPEANPERLQWLADAALRLLQLDGRNLTPTELRRRHRGRMRDLGLVTARGRLDCRGAEQALIEHWGEPLLNELDLHPSSSYRRNSSWIRKRAGPVAKPSAGHPLLHLLLIGLYGINVEAFLDHDYEEVIPISSVPVDATVRECANPACAFFRPYDERRTARRAYLRTGTAWHCNACDARYEEFHNRRGGIRFLETGRLWDTAFHQQAESGTALSQLALFFEMSKDLVLCHATRLGVWHNDWGNAADYSLEERRAQEQEITQRRRKEWLHARRAAPDANRKELQVGLPAVTAWLRTHDNAWLIANSPAPRAKQGARSGIDWPARDRTLCRAVEGGIGRLLQEGPPVQLTLAAIGREAGVRNMITKNPGRLPVTMARINAAVETVETFVRRRIQWHAQEQIQENELPVYSDFLERCGIEWRHRHRFDSDLRSAIDDIHDALMPQQPQRAQTSSGLRDI